MTADQDAAAEICRRLLEGESLRSICADDAMPGTSTVFRWLENDEEFRKQYTLARQLQADLLFDEIHDIADDASKDWTDRTRKDGSVERVVDTEAVLRSKLRVDARKWMAAKLLPKKYGDRLDVSVDDQTSFAAQIEAARRRASDGASQPLLTGSNEGPSH